MLPNFKQVVIIKYTCVVYFDELFTLYVCIHVYVYVYVNVCMYVCTVCMY